MRKPNFEPIYEAMVGFRGCTRYVAHSKIDDAFRPLPRGELRAWHPSVIRTSENGFVGAIRTQSQEVMTAMPGATWRELILPQEGMDVDCYVQITPKKTAQFGAFRSRAFAIKFVESRLQERQALSQCICEYLASDIVDISKAGNSYHSPAAWFRIRGKVQSASALSDLVLLGIGGAHTFGVGLLNPAGSQIHEIARKAADAAALSNMTQTKGELVHL